MSITTAEEFFSVLEKSNLLPPERLAEVRRGTSREEDATVVARALARDGLINHWQAGQLLAGKFCRLGKYKLLNFLGRGGMGSVFLGEHTVMNRRVALKVISRQIGKDPASLERFLGEARAIAALDHPNIVQAYSVDNEGAQYYIVMEFVDGIDLQRLVETEGPLDYERAVDYVRQAADGLAHAHQRNMVHCDIKPSNLLVNQQGTIKILDMGLARLVGHPTEESVGPEDSVLGSVDYLAPEQALGSRDFDHRADIYSLGCTLYFLLTGHPPFPEGTLTERIIKHQTQQPVSICQQRRDAPRDLVAICEKMMAKKAEDRFQSADEVSRALAQWRPSSLELQAEEPQEKAAATAVGVGDLGFGKDEPAPGKAAAGPARPGAASSLLDSELSAPIAAVPLAAAPAARHRPTESGQRKSVALAVAAATVVALAAVTTLFLVLAGRHGQEAEPTQVANLDKSLEEHPVPPTPPSAPEGPPQPAEPRNSSETATTKSPSDEPEPEPPQPKEGKRKRNKFAEDVVADLSRPLPPLPEPKQPKNLLGAQKPKRGPLRDLPKEVDLPPIGEKAEAGEQVGGTVELGKIYLPDNAIDSLKIRLLGSREALRGKGMFVLQHDETSAARWRVGIGVDDPAADNTNAVEVARIWLEKETLKFAWSDQAAAQSRASAFRYCGLLITAAGPTRWLPLSCSKKVEPIVLDFTEFPQTVPLPLESVSDPSTLRLQITGLEGNLPIPTHEVQPKEPIAPLLSSKKDPKDPMKGMMSIVFKEGDQPLIRLAIAFEVPGRAARIQISPYFLRGLADDKPLWSKYDAKNVNSLMKNWQQKFEALAKNKGPAQQFARASLDRLKYVKEAFETLRRELKIHYRIFSVTEESHRVVELFNTRLKAAAPPATAHAP